MSFADRNNNNPYLQRLDQLDEARKKWTESEWRLNFLRTITNSPVKEIGEEELLAWNQHKNNHINQHQFNG